MAIPFQETLATDYIYIYILECWLLNKSVFQQNFLLIIALVAEPQFGS